MKRRSIIWCICVIAVLLVPTAAYGEILTDGYWDGADGGAGGSSGGWWTYSSVTAWADGNNPWCWGMGEGWFSVYTTETASLNWSWTAYAWAEAQAWNVGGPLDYAMARATAQVNLPWQPRAADFEVKANTAWDNPDSCQLSDSGSSVEARVIQANRGIVGDHSAVALSAVVSGTQAQAYSHACAHAFGNLWE